jgi:prolyl-tRNA editing enzyme YbaK/EbsC (Cys-tRNA(Pro) deacylase)
LDHTNFYPSGYYPSDYYPSDMEHIKEKSAVKRVIKALQDHGISGEVHALSESARTAQEAASSLGIEVGQIASSLIFQLPDNSPLLIITSGRHRVDTELVAQTLGLDSLSRVDAQYVKEKSGFSIGGVAPIGWLSPATIVIDEALNDYDVVWAAAGHPHAVYPTTYAELVRVTGARPMIVGD